MPLQVSASRFAVLPDDDLSNWEQPKSKKKAAAAAGNQQQQQPAKKKQPKKPLDEAERLRQDAFGGGSAGKKNKKKKQQQQQQLPEELTTTTPAAAAAPSNPEQFEAWKEADNKAVDDVFQKDLEEALRESMVQAEADRTLQREREVTRAANTAIAATKKRMTLNQFHQMSDDLAHLPADVAVAAAAVNEVENSVKKNSSNHHSHHHRGISESSDFFSEIDKGAKKIVNRERIAESIKNSMVASDFERESAAKASELLSQKDDEIRKLRVGNELLQSELTKVKSRYKVMRGILEQAEIREKAEIVAEVIKLRNFKDEMSEQVQKLTEELEQNKTKVVVLEKQLKQAQERRPMAATTAGATTTK